MCGICGISGKINNRSIRIDDMLTAMRHRGPDDQGTWHGVNTSLGTVRLSILDLSPAGHQPMSNAAGTIWIAYNGEMYNSPTMREELIKTGHLFKSNSDTEVVLKLYEIYGDKFLSYLKGMFAVAIVDLRSGPNQEKVLLARDPLGIKPLLYSITAGGLIFASEMKPLLASQIISRQINLEALAQLLTYGSIPQPMTFIQNVQMLPPAHYLIYQSGKTILNKYWEFDLTSSTTLSSQPYPELVEALRKQLSATCQSHLLSDVPVGAFLSGGVDSTVIVALTAQNHSGRMKTFSIGFGREGKTIDETDRAQTTANHLGTDHTRIEITGQDVARQLQKFIQALDQPSVDGLNSYLVAQAAQPAVKVALSGLGGDELFAGYPWFNHLVNTATLHRLPITHEMLKVIAKIFASPIFRLAPSGRKISRIIAKLRGLTDTTSQFLSENQVLGEIGTQHLLIPAIKTALKENQPSFTWPSTPSIIQQTSMMTLKTYTQNQLLRDMDTVSMYHSLEVRVPYLDTDLVNLTLNLPDYTKLKSTIFSPHRGTYRALGSKRILIDAARDLLPPNIDQQIKLGFGLPLGEWIRSDLKTAAQDLLSPATINKRGLFQSQVIDQLYAGFKQNRVPWTIIWLLMVIELWCQEFLD